MEVQPDHHQRIRIIKPFTVLEIPILLRSSEVQELFQIQLLEVTRVLVHKQHQLNLDLERCLEDQELLLDLLSEELELPQDHPLEDQELQLVLNLVVLV